MFPYFLDKLADSLPTIWSTYLSSFASYFTVEFFAMSCRSPKTTPAACFSNVILPLFSSKNNLPQKTNLNEQKNKLNIKV
jgi:hypothetical protein